VLSDVFAEDFDKQIGAAVRDCGVSSEIWCRGDKDACFDNSRHSIEITDGILE
jgi:hypothetical protein